MYIPVAVHFIVDVCMAKWCVIIPNCEGGIYMYVHVCVHVQCAIKSNVHKKVALGVEWGR